MSWQRGGRVKGGKVRGGRMKGDGVRGGRVRGESVRGGRVRSSKVRERQCEWWQGEGQQGEVRQGHLGITLVTVGSPCLPGPPPGYDKHLINQGVCGRRRDPHNLPRLYDQAH